MHVNSTMLPLLGLVGADIVVLVVIKVVLIFSDVPHVGLK